MDENGSVNKRGRSYEDTVPISNLSEVLRNIQRSSDHSKTPSDTASDDDKILEFARLIPSNRAACRAFDAIARKMRADDEWNPHHRQFIVIDADIGIPISKSYLNSKPPPETFSDILQARIMFDDDVSDSDTLPLEREETLLTGYYRLSLDVAPQFARLGWRVGSGRPRYPNDAVDFILTPPGYHNVGVAGSHARFQFERRSGTLLLVASNLRGVPVGLNGQNFAHDMRIVGRPNNTIEFGDLTYHFEYTIKGPKEEERYQQSLRTYFEYAYGSQPIPSSSATPSAHDRELGDYILRNTLARGGSGIVSVASHIKTGSPVAVKEIIRTRWNYQRVAQEISISKLLKHERLAELYDVFYERGESTYRSRDSPERIYLFLTLAQGTFRALFTSLIEYRDRLEFFRQGLEGIAFLHRQGIMHRDIKPANIAVKQFDPPSAFIIDLGCATQEPRSTENVGTIPYLAPEIRTGSKHDRSIDIWSYGVVALELFLLRPPVNSGIPRLDSDALSGFQDKLLLKSRGNHSIEKLIIMLLGWKPAERISAEDALRYPSLILEGPPKFHIADMESDAPRKRFEPSSNNVG